MKARCYIKSTKQFKDYGGRGITVCARWLAPSGDGFRNFVADMGPRPDGFTLDRINNDLGYSPENCRWASRRAQQHNQTVTRKIVVDGAEYVAAEIAQAVGLKTDTVMARAARGLSLLEIASPIRSVGGAPMLNRAKTHCPQGHSYAEKAAFTPKGARYCMECKRIKQSVRNKAISASRKAARG